MLTKIYRISIFICLHNIAQLSNCLFYFYVIISNFVEQEYIFISNDQFNIILFFISVIKLQIKFKTSSKKQTFYKPKMCASTCELKLSN